MGVGNVFVFGVIYFAPTLIAWFRNRRGNPVFGSIGQIFVLNLLLGWTVVGWILTLANAFGLNPVAWTDYRSVSVFFNNWRYNFLGANLLVYKLRQLGFDPIRYRRLPFCAWGLTWNFIQHMVLWRYRLKMRTFVELESIIWRTSKAFVFGNAYNTVLATRPTASSAKLGEVSLAIRTSAAASESFEPA